MVLAACFFTLLQPADGVALPLVKPLAIFPLPLFEPHLPLETTYNLLAAFVVKISPYLASDKAFLILSYVRTLPLKAFLVSRFAPSLEV